MNFKTIILGAAVALAFSPAAFAGRGTDGEVKIIYWQAPSILNPYLSNGTKDIESSSLILEPLARYDPDGGIVPFLAANVPTTANGGVSADLKTITWTLNPSIVWSDGTPFTAADVKFTYDYCMDPAGGCANTAKFNGVTSVEAPDAATVVITFADATPNPYGPFVGGQTPILQQAQFANCMGAAAQTCSKENFGPIGTGAYAVVDFKPNDVIRMVANQNYRDANKPAFATLLFKGGGDATGAGRSVLETGEFDYAWNLQLAPDVIKNMEAAGKGVAITGYGPSVERIEFNMTDPSPSLDEDTRATRKAPHPFLSDIRVRKAMSMAIDRVLLTEIGYGQMGKATCDLVPAPTVYSSQNDFCIQQDIAGANALLDSAGWVTGSDGVRTKDGMRLSVLYQTSTNAVRQDYQALVKQWWAEIGVETELRNLSASIFFGGDPGSPDTFQKFYADVEMYTNNFDGTDPQTYLAAYLCGNEPSPDNQWQGENINRYCDPAYDALHAELTRTGDIEKRYALAKKLNDMLTKDSYTMAPLTHRGRVAAHSNTLGGVVMNTWDSELWNAADWFRIK
ncbi:MAG: peptide ABC transporter substrate-binding protein [Proteobacteria bacterium]|nr:peptide ABC transporter substrate-binding protein [Pseudomonadota bacterium]MDA1237899.1 peptide ABC transporter substrate-binding protein [Pseudomonadota bacterium]